MIGTPTAKDEAHIDPVYYCSRAVCLNWHRGIHGGGLEGASSRKHRTLQSKHVHAAEDKPVIYIAARVPAFLSV